MSLHYPLLSQVWYSDPDSLNFHKSITCSLCGYSSLAAYWCGDKSCHYGLCHHCYLKAYGKGESDSRPGKDTLTLPVPRETCAKCRPHRPEPGRADLSHILIPTIIVQFDGLNLPRGKDKYDPACDASSYPGLIDGLGIYRFHIPHRAQLTEGALVREIDSIIGTMSRISAEQLVLYAGAHKVEGVGLGFGTGGYFGSEFLTAQFGRLAQAFRERCVVHRPVNARVFAVVCACDQLADVWEDHIETLPPPSQFDLLSFEQPLPIAVVPGFFARLLWAFTNDLRRRPASPSSAPYSLRADIGFVLSSADEQEYRPFLVRPDCRKVRAFCGTNPTPPPPPTDSPDAPPPPDNADDNDGGNDDDDKDDYEAHSLRLSQSSLVSVVLGGRSSSPVVDARSSSVVSSHTSVGHGAAVVAASSSLSSSSSGPSLSSSFSSSISSSVLSSSSASVLSRYATRSHAPGSSSLVRSTLPLDTRLPSLYTSAAAAAAAASISAASSSALSSSTASSLLSSSVSYHFSGVTTSTSRVGSGSATTTPLSVRLAKKGMGPNQLRDIARTERNQWLVCQFSRTDALGKHLRSVLPNRRSRAALIALFNQMLEKIPGGGIHGEIGVSEENSQHFLRFLHDHFPWMADLSSPDPVERVGIFRFVPLPTSTSLAATLHADIHHSSSAASASALSSSSSSSSQSTSGSSSSFRSSKSSGGSGRP